MPMAILAPSASSLGWTPFWVVKSASRSSCRGCSTALRMSGAIQLIRRPHERELTDDALAAPKRFHGRQYPCQGITAGFGQHTALEGLERHPRRTGQRELADNRHLSGVDEERIGCSCDAMDLGLGVLGLELLREQGEL